MQTFYIEADSINSIIKISKKYSINCPQYVTPYQGYLFNIEVNVSEEELLRFFEVVKKTSKNNLVKTYIKQKGKYEPFITLNTDDKLVYTTFFYKNLNNLGQSVNTTGALENLIINSRKKDWIRGYYRCTKWNEQNTEVTNEHSGKFQISEEKDEKNSIIHIFMQNTHPVKKENSSYDNVFIVPWNQKVKDIESEEYYITYTDDIILHAAPNMDVIEAYTKIDGIMSLTPFRVFSRTKENLSIMEQYFLLAVNNYEQERKCAEVLQRKQA